MRRVVSRGSHTVEAVAILTQRAAAAEHLRSAIHSVGVIKPEIVSHLVCEDVYRDVVLSIDPHVTATDRSQAPPRAAASVAGHQIDVMRIARQVITGRLRGGECVGLDRSSVAVRTRDWHREPAGNISGQPGMLE